MITNRRSWAWSLVLLLAPLAGLAGAQQATEKPKRPDIYDPKADAQAQLDAATVKARREGQRVLLMFGGNWCGWCHKLHDLFAKDDVAKKVLRDEYVLVMVDTQAPHAEDLLARCKAALAPDERNRVGYPFLAVLDADGKVVVAQQTDPLEVGDHHDPKKVDDFLIRWVAEPRDARKVLDDALTHAASEDKRIFLHFGAPWCGFCHKLDDFLAREEIATIVGRDFLDIKIDTERMTGGKDLMARYRTDDQDKASIPWCAVLDPKGAVLVSSDGPKGNIGYPSTPEEIDQFLALLRKTARRIEPGQFERIEKALKDAAEKIKAAREKAPAGP